MPVYLGGMGGVGVLIMGIGRCKRDVSVCTIGSILMYILARTEGVRGAEDGVDGRLHGLGPLPGVALCVCVVGGGGVCEWIDQTVLV